MRNKLPRIFIIGAGPIGCYFAKLIERKGFEPVLIEEHREVGRPVHCAGLVGKQAFAETQVPLSSECIISTINGAIFNLKNNMFKIKREKVAYIINREKFDKHLGQGLDIRFGTKFLGLEEKGAHYIIETDKGDFEADIVIGADGAKSLVRDFVNSGMKMEYLTGVQFRMKYEMECKDMVEVYIKKPYFYWIIPENDGIVRVGVISKTPYKDLLEFIQEKKIKGKILEKFAGVVPLNSLFLLSKNRIFLIGDSACQIKPFTYGGVYMGMRGAEILANCLVKNKLSDYSLLWKKKFGRAIKVSLKMRNTFHKLTDKELMLIFSFFKEKKSLIEKKADFENHSLLIWEFLKQKGASKILLNIFLNMIEAQFRS